MRPAAIRRAPAWILGICIGLAVQPAAAQFLPDTSDDFVSRADAVKESVRRRARPDYEPLGLRLGDVPELFTELVNGDEEGPLREQPGARPPERLGKAEGLRDAPVGDLLATLVLRPSFELEARYDDNIFNNDFVEESDRILVARPELELRSDWARHELRVKAEAEVGRHDEFDTEDYEDYGIELRPRIDVDDATRLDLRAELRRSHEQRGRISFALQTAEPTKISLSSYGATWSYEADVLLLRLKWDSAFISYEDGVGALQSTRDRWEHDLAFRIGAEFWPGTVLWLEPSWRQIDYDDSRDQFGFDRDNDGYRLLAGLTYDLSAVTFLEFGAGYYDRQFDDPTFNDLRGFATEGRLVWNFTPLMTLEAFVSRDIDESFLVGANASESLAAGLRLGWDPLENLIFDFRLSGEHREFQRTRLVTTKREDDLLTFRADVRYLFNPSLFCELGYRHEELVSSFDPDAYTDNVFRVALGARL